MSEDIKKEEFLLQLPVTDYKFLSSHGVNPVEFAMALFDHAVKNMSVKQMADILSLWQESFE